MQMACVFGKSNCSVIIFWQSLPKTIDLYRDVNLMISINGSNMAHWTYRSIECFPYSLTTWRYRCNLARVFFEFMLRIDILNTSCEICLRWVLQNPTDDKGTLIQAIEQKAITWANFDPYICRHMASLGHKAGCFRYALETIYIKTTYLADTLGWTLSR